MDKDIEKEFLDEITGKAEVDDNKDVVSLTGIKPGELGSKEKPARSLNEFRNLAADKMSDENIDKQIDKAPSPVTNIDKESVNNWLAVGINLLYKREHKVWQLLLKSRLLGASYEAIAFSLGETVETVKAIEKRAILEIKDLIAKNQGMLNNGCIINK